MENEEAKEYVDLAPEIKFTDVDLLSLEELLRLAQENYELMNYDKCCILYEEALRKKSKRRKSIMCLRIFSFKYPQ